jgi:FSR family fosmidomycin resistance protein-like MFS transporter
MQTNTRPQYNVLASISLSHFLNDMMQSLILAVYPMLKTNFHLSFIQIGLITLSYQATASLLQPLVGIYTDKHSKPFSLVFGMACTLAGILMLAFAGTYPLLLLAAMMVGMGSSIFHPEAARVSRIASEGRFGLAQSIFQVGGNVGAAMGPLLAAWIVIPHSQASVGWFSPAALLAMIVLLQVGFWYRERVSSFQKAQKNVHLESPLSRQKIIQTIILLIVLVFSLNLNISK